MAVHGLYVRHAALAEEWARVRRSEGLRVASNVAEWQSTLAAMKSERADTVIAGHWRAGPRTLLAALGRQDRELALTAGLAWLLRPDGHHGLGPRLLAALLDELGLHGAPPATRAIVREEERIVTFEGAEQITRADLVVYGAGWTLVFEAKAYAVEQPAQLDRLFEGWRGEPDPTFIFLTRGARVPTTAVTSEGLWRSLTWRTVARHTRAAVDDCPSPAPGVRDYITTLEAYHGV